MGDTKWFAVVIIAIVVVAAVLVFVPREEPVAPVVDEPVVEPDEPEVAPEVVAAVQEAKKVSTDVNFLVLPQGGLSPQTATVASGARVRLHVAAGAGSYDVSVPQYNVSFTVSRGENGYAEFVAAPGEHTVFVDGEPAATIVAQ